MLAGITEAFSTGIQQAAIADPYQDQVKNAGLTAWYKLDEEPTKSPIAGVRQKPAKSLTEFIDGARWSINHKLGTGALRDQFVTFPAVRFSQGQRKSP